MVSFTLMFTALATAAAVIASPVARSYCDTSNYGPFKLYAQEQGQRDAQLVRLVYIGSDSDNNAIITMTVCDNCGDAPAYWTLDDRILTPHLLDVVAGQETVNRPLSQGKVNFVTGNESSIEKSRIFCAVRNILAVSGDADNFSICSFNEEPGIAPRRDVYFNQTPNQIAYNCQPARLVMESA